MLEPRYAIINGDDFGVSHHVNRAIIQAHEQGILTSASLMVAGDAAADAVELAKAYPQLGVGLHLVLGCGKSVLPPHQIPHLVDAQGNFPDNPLIAGLRYSFNRAAQQELRQEIRAQLAAFQATGLPLCHVDGHLHHHVNPVVLNTLVEYATDFQIPLIRLPSEELSLSLKLDRSNLVIKLVWSLIFGQLRRYGEPRLARYGIRAVERVYGLLQTGQIDTRYLLGLIPQIRANIIEIYAHPGFLSADGADDGQPNTDLRALVDPKIKTTLEAAGFQLINASQLP